MTGEAGVERSDEAEKTGAGTVALALMCKAPLPGNSKTRLSPPLSRSEAATLAGCFIADMAETVAGVCADPHTRGYVLYTPADALDAFGGLLPAGIEALPQRGETLDERCSNAVEDLLGRGHAAVCLLNADSPTLPAQVLGVAADALRRPGPRLVLGPALDGGYYLIGVKRSDPELFRGIPWSTGQVLTATLARAGEIDLEVEHLPPWYDVDDGLSLAALLQELFGPASPPAEEGAAAPAAVRTRAYLSSLLARGEGPPPGCVPNL
jgi:uncharacterized protein